MTLPCFDKATGRAFRSPALADKTVIRPCQRYASVHEVHTPEIIRRVILYFAELQVPIKSKMYIAAYLHAFG